MYKYHGKVFDTFEKPFQSRGVSTNSQGNIFLYIMRFYRKKQKRTKYTQKKYHMTKAFDNNQGFANGERPGDIIRVNVHSS